MADNDVVAQKSKLVGDESLPDPVDVSVDSTEKRVAAQVAPDREKDAAKVSVDEVVVVTDEVITDPSDPKAVQVPDAGRGDASTPIAVAYRDGERVEDVFAREASEVDSDEEPAPEENPSV
jgi:hypothetical protein